MGASIPLEANPPLVINADAVLAGAVSSQRLKSVPGQRSQISKGCSRLQTVKLQTSGPCESGKRLDRLSSGEVPGSLVAIADNHQFPL